MTQDDILVAMRVATDEIADVLKTPREHRTQQLDERVGQFASNSHAENSEY